MITAAAIVAHQGGWDEILLVAGPIVLIVGLLTLAKRRVDAASAANQPAPTQPAAGRSAPDQPRQD
ncbi:MAG: hypothetical protein ABWZ42_01470 [Ilumatobacteraceae bacterium]